MINDLIIPTLSIKPNYLAIYNQWLGANSYKRRSEPSTFKLHANAHGGVLSTHSAKKIKNSVNWLIALAKEKDIYTNKTKNNFKFKLNFITLTLSAKQFHDDNTIKSQCLNQFLTEARKKWGVKNYIWRAEKQKNGNIHFHVITDVFIPWYELRNVWNRIQGKLGYIDMYRKEITAFHSGGFKLRKDLLKSWEYKNQVRAWKYGNKTGWSNPNSVDVHSIFKVKNVSAYICKYLTKNQPAQNNENIIIDNKLIIKGRLYGVSYGLSKIKAPAAEIDNYISSELKFLKQKFPDSYRSGEHYQVLLINYDLLNASETPFIHSLFNQFINSFNP